MTLAQQYDELLEQYHLRKIDSKEIDSFERKYMISESLASYGAGWFSFCSIFIDCSVWGLSHILTPKHILCVYHK